MMHTDIKIVKMSPDHMDAVEELENTCFSHPWCRKDLDNQLTLDTSHFLVALVDGNVAGYMGVQIFSGEGYVTNIATFPHYRRRGIAKALMCEALKNDMDFLTLEVRPSNIPAIELYNSFDFENMGIRRNFYSDPDEDAIIMTRYFDEKEG